MTKSPETRHLFYSAHPGSAHLSLEPGLLEQLRKLSPKSSQQGEVMKPLFSREDLEKLASGKISALFGPKFVEQDDYLLQVRMPMPPLLLADRVMKLEGEPCSMSKGSIWTETDVLESSWYLHEGNMPPGIMIETGQADLLLTSWMGIDFYNKGQRSYRLLGADITFYNGLPKPGDTINYEIHLDNFAQLGELRLAFFHYVGKINDQPRIILRHGQAGFFSSQELAESSGILWDPNTATYKKEARVDPPKVIPIHRSFAPAQIKAFSQGDTYGCFGAGFEAARSHQHSPRIPQGDMRFIDEITHFDPHGGPKGRGYMRAVQNVSAEDWFFKCHFKDDPCMPGTLMFQAGTHVMNFYLAALGYTLDKDGWKFEPVPGEEVQSRCRGQCHPGSKQVVYEIFVEEVIAEPYPTVIVDLLATIDGLKSLHAHHMSMRLVPSTLYG